ncbi:thiamine pyrophosphate-binding protein [Pseudorhodobacter sp.]|uniref:thiamine pyrophosphate-binding protein n=1 Tax=Pseudorhodobacter sp. TaxID=1934400 RepID=UPI00264A4353|nr:thiamine pyrophosphate-binding protein [Pseudorhodobacter sp.]MDN5786620.1 thiamine pyrophosphate-binding protein [Pseudorhodobacter sp.]
MRHGGKILVDQLAAQGITRVFSVPGESFLAALDALHDSGIENIVCRQEGGAAMMAEAHGKMTGKPGVLFVTRGPGATNASAGIHIAKQDSTPMVVFVGQIAREHRDREAFQEVDYRAVFGTLAKWATEVDQIERLPEYISHAFHLATSGRPGPVVLALPEDMLSATADVTDLPAVNGQPFAISTEQVQAVTDALTAAKRPLVIAGGPNWSAQAAADLETFAESWNLPVAVSFRRQDRMSNDHPNFVGDLGVGMNPKLGRMLTQADVLLVLGARLGDTTTNGYELLDPTKPGPRILHIHPDPSELGRVFHPTLAIPVRADQMLTRLAQTKGKGDWAEWANTARTDYEAWQKPVETPGAVKLEQVVAWLAESLPHDSILTNGAGNYAAFLHRYYRFRSYGTQLAPTSGSMGYGFPASIAASLQNPDKTVVCMAGDGCFQMTCNEASTAIQHGAKPIVIVANNGRYGTIRMHQERHYPGRPSGTDLANPDFAALARAYGGHGETVSDQADFPAAFARAQAANTLAVIELKLDPDMLTTGQSLSQVQKASAKT